MKLFRASNIVWDLDEGDTPASLGLPYSVHVYAESEDDVADAISDEMGWCVRSLDVVEITETLVFD